MENFIRSIIKSAAIAFAPDHITIEISFQKPSIMTATVMGKTLVVAQMITGSSKVAIIRSRTTHIEIAVFKHNEIGKRIVLGIAAVASVIQQIAFSI